MNQENKMERLSQWLRERGVTPEVVVMEQHTATAEAAAKALGCELGQIAKSLVFRNKIGDYAMIVAAGDVQLDNQKVKRLLGGRSRMANAEELLEMTGYGPGEVCPFALRQSLPVWLDHSLCRYEQVYTGAGSDHALLTVSYAMMLDLAGGQPGHFTIEG